MISERSVTTPCTGIFSQGAKTHGPKDLRCSKPRGQRDYFVDCSLTRVAVDIAESKAMNQSWWITCARLRCSTLDHISSQRLTVQGLEALDKGLHMQELKLAVVVDGPAGTLSVL